MPSTHLAFAGVYGHVLHYSEFRKHFKISKTQTFGSLGKETGFRLPAKHSAIPFDGDRMNEFIGELEATLSQSPCKPTKTLSSKYPSECTLLPFLFLHLQDRVKFGAKFDNFLREQNLHPAKFLAEHRDALKASQQPTETTSTSWMTVDPPAIKPSPSTVTDVESHLSIIHHWMFGAEGFKLKQPISRTAMFTKLCYQAAWNREHKHFVRDSENLKTTIGKLESDWEKFGDSNEIKARFEVAGFLKRLEKASKEAEFVQDKEIQQKLFNWKETVGRILRLRNTGVFRQQGITTVSKAQLAAWKDMLNSEEVKVLQQEWGHFLVNETDPEAVSKDSTAADELRNPGALNRYFQSTMGVHHYVNTEMSKLVSDLGGDPLAETLPYLMTVVPKAGWRSLFGTHGLSSQRNKVQCKAAKAFQLQNAKKLEAAAQVTQNLTPMDTEDGFSLPEPVTEGGEKDRDDNNSDNNADEDIDDDTEEDIAKYLQDWLTLKPHWHQLVAVHAIIRHLLGEVGPNDGHPGMLIADDVGLGKTAVVIIALLVIADLIDRNKAGHPWPAIYGRQGRALFYGKTEPVSQPHLIVVPGHLAENWVNEIEAWAGNHLEIYHYTGTLINRPDWFEALSTSSVFQRREHFPAHRKVIIATLNAVASDAKDCLQPLSPSASKSDPKALKLPVPSTILNQQFLTVVFDELHECRNGKHMYDAALRLRHQAITSIGLTATPYHSRLSDIFNCGRIIGIPGFCGEAADREEAIILRREKSAIKKFSKMQKAAASAESMVDLSASEESEDVESEGESNAEAISDHALIDAQNLQKKFAGHIIRRTHDSAGKDGTVSENIIGLSKPIFRTVILPLTEVEQDTMRKIAAVDGTTPKKLKKNSTFLDFSLQAAVENYGTAFYIRKRQGAFNPALTFSIVSQTGVPASYRDQSDFWARASSKEKFGMRATLWHTQLKNKHGNLAYWDEQKGDLAFESSEPIQQAGSANQPAKIVIYIEFVSMMYLLQSGFDAFGVSWLELSGNISAKRKTEVLQEFSTGPTSVLFLSPAGKTGFNITCAHIMIIMTPFFSQQTQRQVIGRIVRQGNENQCIIYTVLAKDTADTIIREIAETKERISNAFNSSPAESVITAQELKGSSAAQRLAQVLEDGKGTMVDVFNDVEESGYEGDKRRTSGENQRGIDKHRKKRDEGHKNKQGKKRPREENQGHGSREDPGKKRRTQQEDEGTSAVPKGTLDRPGLRLRIKKKRQQKQEISPEVVEDSDSALSGTGEYEGSAEPTPMVKSSQHDNFENAEPEFQNDGTANLDYRDDDIAEINEPSFTQDVQPSQMSDLGPVASPGEPEPQTEPTSATSGDGDDDNGLSDDDEDDSELDSPASDAYAVKSRKDMTAGHRTPKRSGQQQAR